MRWLFPAGAWGFVSLAVITALYLLKRRSESLRVPSLLLWQRALAEQQAMKPFQKLKKNILYFLQLAMAVLLTLALMRPAVPGGAQGECVMVFDLSASMQAQENGETRLDEAKRRALDLMDSLRSGDRVTVLAAGKEAEILLSRCGDLARVRSAVSSLRARNGGADMAAAVSLAQAMARDIPGLTVLAFSDTYESDDVKVVRVGAPRENRALLSLSARDGQAFARVANYGGVATVTLLCEADGALCDAVTVELAADETRSVLLQTPPEARTVAVSIQEQDALDADNRRWYAARDDGAYRAVLCGDNIFLEKALSLREDLTLLRASGPEAAAVEDVDLYIFDGALPAALPQSGALLCVAPDGPVLGVTPGSALSAAGRLRAGLSERARKLTAHLLLEDIALRVYTPLTGGETVLRSGEDAIVSIAEADGRRAAVLGFDLHDSNLPMKGDFPVLMQNLLSFLLPDVRQSVRDGVCGENIVLPADARALESYALTPSAGRFALNALPTDEQGVYTAVYRYADGGERQARFVLHMDTAESDTRRVGGRETGVTLQTGAAAGRELTLWVLLVFLALSLAEWEVSRRVA